MRGIEAGFEVFAPDVTLTEKVTAGEEVCIRETEKEIQKGIQMQ